MRHDSLFSPNTSYASLLPPSSFFFRPMEFGNAIRLYPRKGEEQLTKQHVLPYSSIPMLDYRQHSKCFPYSAITLQSERPSFLLVVLVVDVVDVVVSPSPSPVFPST